MRESHALRRAPFGTAGARKRRALRLERVRVGRFGVFGKMDADEEKRFGFFGEKRANAKRKRNVERDPRSVRLERHGGDDPATRRGGNEKTKEERRDVSIRRGGGFGASVRAPGFGAGEGGSEPRGDARGRRSRLRVGARGGRAHGEVMRFVVVV